MTIINVHGWAGVFRKSADNDNEAQITDKGILRRLDGAPFSSLEIAEYLQDGEETSCLHDIGVTGGRTTLRYNTATGTLSCEAQYRAPRLLTADELELLRVYTYEQFIDGIGEGDLPVPFDPNLVVSVGGADEWTTISQE
jgi:hypothetical protein